MREGIKAPRNEGQSGSFTGVKNIKDQTGHANVFLLMATRKKNMKDKFEGTEIYPEGHLLEN